MKYVAKHQLDDLARVKTVIEKAYESYAQRLADYKPRIKWNNDRQAVVDFTVMSKKIEANFDITDEEVRINGQIPFIFRPFQGRIEKVIGEEVEKWLAKARAGEI
jgi:hypothetical protein